MRHFLEKAQNSNLAFPTVCLIYVLGGFFLFPVTLLSLITAATFGPFWGPVYAMGGSLLSGIVMFGIGHFAGFKLLRRVLGERIRKIDYHLREVGIWGIAIIRFLPLAPYTIVNLAAGMSSVCITDFIIGSFIGFLPSLIIKGLVGDALIKTLLKPTTHTTLYLILGFLAWLILMFFSIRLAKRWRGRVAHEV